MYISYLCVNCKKYGRNGVKLGVEKNYKKVVEAMKKGGRTAKNAFIDNLSSFVEKLGTLVDKIGFGAIFGPLAVFVVRKLKIPYFSVSILKYKNW
ncbi:MAG: hypothetical protein IK005_10760 [Paludibacteraceae bacterium]|nr:hypothetical protein [Paludibacteraceae bacterium]